MPTEINFPRDTTLKETNKILRSLAPLAVQFDGTAEGYKRVMRRWFLDNGALEADTDALTALCDKWYTLTRVPWHGWTSFAQPDVTAVSTGTRGGLRRAPFICGHRLQLYRRRRHRRTENNCHRRNN